MSKARDASARLKALAGGTQPARPSPVQSPPAVEANPPRGKRGDYVKISLTVPVEIADALETERLRRKRANRGLAPGDPRRQTAELSGILREILVLALPNLLDATAK